MGYIAHDAVVAVLGSDHPSVAELRDEMPERFRPLLVGPVGSAVNFYVSWVFLPDGSKEGWDASDEADEWRARFVALMTELEANWVHVRFGGDYGAECGVTVEGGDDV